MSFKKDLFVEAIKKNLQHVNVLPDELKDELHKVTAIYRKMKVEYVYCLKTEKCGAG